MVQLKSLIPSVGAEMHKIVVNPPKTQAGFDQVKLRVRAATQFGVLSGQELQYDKILERAGKIASKCCCGKGKVKVPAKYSK